MTRLRTADVPGLRMSVAAYQQGTSGVCHRKWEMANGISDSARAHRIVLAHKGNDAHVVLYPISHFLFPILDHPPMANSRNTVRCSGLKLSSLTRTSVARPSGSLGPRVMPSKFSSV